MGGGGTNNQGGDAKRPHTSTLQQVTDSQGGEGGRVGRGGTVRLRGGVTAFSGVVVWCGVGGWGGGGGWRCKGVLKLKYLGVAPMPANMSALI